eukprot:1197676-Amphidinium_carterae.1
MATHGWPWAERHHFNKNWWRKLCSVCFGSKESLACQTCPGGQSDSQSISGAQAICLTGVLWPEHDMPRTNKAVKTPLTLLLLHLLQ